MYHRQIELSDVDRGVYESLDLRVARHPSESARYLLMRVGVVDGAKPAHLGLHHERHPETGDEEPQRDALADRKQPPGVNEGSIEADVPRHARFGELGPSNVDRNLQASPATA
jgi:hypothetical protein